MEEDRLLKIDHDEDEEPISNLRGQSNVVPSWPTSLSRVPSLILLISICLNASLVWLLASQRNELHTTSAHGQYMEKEGIHAVPDSE